MTESRSKTLEVMARGYCAEECRGHRVTACNPCRHWGIYSEEAERLFSALQAEGMAVVQGWQPIETKPRDHFPALVWSERLGQVVAFLDVTWTWWPQPAIEPLSSAPTHWRPLLPASPYGKAVVKENDDE